MSATRRLPNPFYVLLMVVSTAFAFTCLSYLIAPSVIDSSTNPRPGGNIPSPGAISAAQWVDRWGTTLLTWEVVIMIALGVAAMLTDRWFSDDKSTSV